MCVCVCVRVCVRACVCVCPKKVLKFQKNIILDHILLETISLFCFYAVFLNV